MRRGALLKDAQLSGMLPTSVAGGENAPGNWSLIAGFCGPGSLVLLGFLALIAPCGGSFGLPKLISLFTGVASAVVIVAAAIAPGTVTSSFGWRQLRLTGGCRLFLFAEQRRLPPVQVDIDDR